MKVPLLKEQNLSNNFLYGAVMSDEEICRLVLQKILGISIRSIRLAEEQKTVNNLLGSKGVVLDIMAFDEEDRIYNVEMQIKNEELPKRSRFYQSSIDVKYTPKGQKYDEMKDTYIIFICCFDPFGDGYHLYNFENQCIYSSGTRLRDGTHHVFVNTRGTRDDVDDELKDFLKYIEDSTQERARSSRGNLVKQVHKKVEEIRNDLKKEVDFMLFEEIVEERVRQGCEREAERITLLLDRLEKDNKEDQFFKAARDKDYREQLYNAYGI